jgi:iron complex transport system ATP-binding protein
VREALGQADIGHLAQRNYQTLSGGERQRVHFARALAQLKAGRTLETRQVLFLDEPISSLDLRHQLALLQEARRLAQAGLAIVAVLHDLQLASSIGDELALMDQGRLIARGAPDDVLTPARLAEFFGVSLTTRRLPPHPWRLVSGYVDAVSAP